MKNSTTDLYLHGKRYLHRGDYENARRCFEGILDETRQNGETDALIDLLLHLGNIEAQLGRPARARLFYQEVLSLPQSESTQRAAALTLLNLGNLCREAGENKRAEAYYLETKDLLHKTGDTGALAVLYSNLGLLAQDEGHLEQARRLLEEAIGLHKKTGYEEGLAATWGQMGRILFQQGEDGNAETCFNYSAMHFSALGDPLGESEALRGLVRVYEKRGDPELALHCLTRLIETQKRYGLKPSESDQEWWNRLNENHWKKTRPPQP